MESHPNSNEMLNRIAEEAFARITHYLTLTRTHLKAARNYYKKFDWPSASSYLSLADRCLAAAEALLAFAIQFDLLPTEEVLLLFHQTVHLAEEIRGFPE